ncbi:MAG: sodium-translocating pyrophosphatase [Prevotella sp.]|nr:sodium-translocating pyrophosphatase [Prevotella sp.]
MNIPVVFWLVPFASICALAMALYFFKFMMKEDEGNKRMREIAGYIRVGAMAYLKQQYKVVIVIFIVLCIIFCFMSYVLHVQNPWVPFAFLTGGFFSGLCGFFGMKTATYASARTANAVSKSLNRGLRVAFRSGAVMGLVVVGLGLLDIAIWFVLLNIFYHGNHMALVTITTTMLTFGMGASTQALFARVGGGIYTKAADVGADLVGKVEADIPEDDPRNPATIADNVGDNVGDVAGMGADLYESYCGSILSTAALGATAFALNGDMQLKAVIAPMLIAAVGIFLSLAGIFMVRTKEGATMKDLLHSLNLGTNVAAILIAVAAFIILSCLNIENWLGVSFSVVCGLAAGVIIGFATEYYTSQSYKPTQQIAAAAQTGSATVIIKGIGTGMISTMIPVVTISVAIIMSYLCANGFDMSMSSESISKGLYGIGIAAVGMLSTLGITLATDAYGPIADNAGGNAEMSQLGEEVRQRTDALDALGNTTAATGKGFAIGSAALTALALLASYVEEVKINMIRATNEGSVFLDKLGNVFDPAKAQLLDMINYFQVTLMNPKVIIGVFIGAMAAFMFSGITMGAVGRAAGSMVEEVRRQFREIKGILQGKAVPDYSRCIEISTRSALREMVFPSLLAIVIPIIVGCVLGVAGVLGLLVGGMSTGFTLAVFMANSGGAWDNAKKMIEEGSFGGKGSSSHKASIVGDTVGDPFKDTSGPSLNILIKLMSMVSIVMAGLTVAVAG